MARAGEISNRERIGKKPSLAYRLLTLPACVAAVFLLYWSSTLASLVGLMPFLDFYSPRNDMLGWSRFLMAVFRVKVLKEGSQKLYKGGRVCIYLANHRSWADFFVDPWVSEGQAMLMSRMLVAAVFPGFVSAAWVIQGVILFKRGTIADKDGFNKWIDQQIASSPVPGLLVYPEGHRSLREKSLPLKRGMLHYAYSRKLPVQMVMTTNKERLLSEKIWRAGFGQTLVTGYSDLLESTDYPDFESFAKAVQASWDGTWDRVYAADPTGLPPLNPDLSLKFNYTWRVKAGQCVLTTVWIMILLTSILLAWQVTSYVVAATLSPLTTKVLLALLAVWSTASYLVSSN